MATNPIGGSPSPVTFPNLLSTFDRGTIASAVEVLVAVLDAMDIDMDLEPEEALTPDYGIDQTKPLPDAMVIASDRANMREHRNRIRRDRCDKLARQDYLGRTHALIDTRQ